MFYIVEGIVIEICSRKQFKRFSYLTNYKKSRSGINDQDRELLYFHMNQYVELHGRRRSIGEWYLPIKGGYRMPGGGDVIQSQPAQGKLRPGANRPAPRESRPPRPRKQ